MNRLMKYCSKLVLMIVLFTVISAMTMFADDSHRTGETVDAVPVGFSAPYSVQPIPGPSASTSTVVITAADTDSASLKSDDDGEDEEADDEGEAKEDQEDGIDVDRIWDRSKRG